jgi:hypothetical protein
MPIANRYLTRNGLKRNPFPHKTMYSEDSNELYIPEMFGDEREEFLRKFFLAPLESGQPLIGAVWSVMPNMESSRGFGESTLDASARGFGKSTLMGEEAKLINRDFGYSTLAHLQISQEDAGANPILAGYVSFNVKGQGGISNIDSAAFNLTRFVLRTKLSSGETLHRSLRERALARVWEEEAYPRGDDTQAIINAVRDRFSKLAVNIDIRRTLGDFLNSLAGEDSKELIDFMDQGVGNWHQDRNGLKYLQVLVMLGELAGIQHFTFFIDQVEDFTSIATPTKIFRNVKIIRDALIEAEPFRTRASFVFQMHPAADISLRNAWNLEELPSIKFYDPLAQPRVVVLKGLQEFDPARNLAYCCLNHPEATLQTRQPSLAPFSEEAVRLVWKNTNPIPRKFLSVLNSLLEIAMRQEPDIIDEAFVMPLLKKTVEQSELEMFGIDDRLS